MLGAYTITLDPWQKEFLETKGDKQLCCGRQIGKSIICSKDAGDYALENPGKTILMIAPTERQAYALFSKTLDYISCKDAKQIMKGKNRPTKTRLKLKNKSVIWCLPTGLNGIGIRFLTVDRLYADEASRIPEDVWEAVTPMLVTTGGDMILLSTPFGTQGYFYDVLINKNNAFKSFTRFRLDTETVLKNRKICDTWTKMQREKALDHIAREKSRMTELGFAQEYKGQPLEDLKQVFPDKLLKNVMVLTRPEKITDGTYYLGQDIAGMGRDDSTWEILKQDEQITEHVENIVKRKLRTPDRVAITQKLDRKYHFRKIGLDDQGIGSGDFDYLLKSEIGRKVISLNNSSRSLTRDGKRKKRILKEDLYNNLLRMMEMGEIKLLKDDSIYESLRSVQFETKDNKTRYFGSDTHIAEGLIRAAWFCRNRRKLFLYYS